MRKTLFSVIAILSMILSINPPATAAGYKPKIEVNCGNLLKLRDNNGDFLYFNPFVKITYYGAPLTINAYYATKAGEPRSEQGKRFVKVTDKASSSKKFSGVFDLSHKFLIYGQKSNGYFHMELDVIDSSKRKTSYKCIFEGDYGFPKASKTPSFTPIPSTPPITQPSNTPNPSPSSSSAELKNDFISFIPIQLTDGKIDIGVLLRNKATKEVWYVLSGVNRQTALKRQFTIQDFYQDKILGCLDFSECLQTSNLLSWGSDSVTQIKFDKTKPFGLYAPRLQGIKFGDNTNEAYALTKFSIGNLISTIYRVNTVSLKQEPIAATYCVENKYSYCENKAEILEINSDHKTGSLQLLIETTNIEGKNESKFSVSKIDVRSPVINLLDSKTNLITKTFDGGIETLYTETNSDKVLREVNSTVGAESIFFIRHERNNSRSMNEICRFRSGYVECKLAAPFDYLEIVQVIDSNVLVVGSGGGKLYLYDFSKNTKEDIKSYERLDYLLRVGS